MSEFWLGFIAGFFIGFTVIVVNFVLLGLLATLTVGKRKRLLDRQEEKQEPANGGVLPLRKQRTMLD